MKKILEIAQKRILHPSVRRIARAFQRPTDILTERNSLVHWQGKRIACAWRAAFVFVLAGAASLAQAANEIDTKLETAMTAETRPQADRERDGNRLPLETLSFFGLRDNMTVIELFPGGGWYTHILGPVLAGNGKLYVALGTDRAKENVLTQPGFDKVEVIETTANARPSEQRGVYLVDDFDLGVENVDMILTFRNLHNFGSESRRRVNAAVFKSLKSGGRYGVVDHTRRHMQADSGENRRRIDPVIVIKELVDLGFEFEGLSDIHYRADDELIYEVGRRSVSGNTDRFTLLFRKP